MHICQNDYFGGYFHIAYYQKGIITIPKLIYDNLGIDIDYDKSFVIDFSSLPILFQLSREHGVVYPKKFLISKHLVELLKNRIKGLKTEPHSAMSLITTSKEVSKVEHTTEQHDNNVCYLENMLQWISQNCEEKVSTRVADMKRSLKSEQAGDNAGLIFVDYVLNTMLLREDYDALIITDDMIYSGHLKLALPFTMSSEVYVKNLLGKDHKAISEFLKNQYIGFDYPISIIIDEFEKYLRGDSNRYDFIIEYALPASWQSFMAFLEYIGTHKHMTPKDKKKELDIVCAKILQYCTSKEMLNTMLAFLIFSFQAHGVPIEMQEMIIGSFMIQVEEPA
jgi:hypothetical protein